MLLVSRAAFATCLILIPFVVAIGGVGNASAAYTPLEITAPRQDLPEDHRMLWAYPGLPYNIRAAVVGGAYPYTFSLSDAPAGMRIDSSTGVITWPSPLGSAKPTLTVRDVEGAQVSQTWAIVADANAFKFVDAARGSSNGDGTINSPWRTLLDVHSRATGRDIVYFRTGIYTTTGIPTYDPGNPLELRVEFDDRKQSVAWLAYPGESPVIDHQYSNAPTPRIRLTGDSIYIDGFEVRNVYVMGFQVVHRNRGGAIFRNLRMHNLMVGGDGSNAAFIMTTGSRADAFGVVVQDSSFCNIVAGDQAVTLKFYGTERLLVEGTTHCSAVVALEVKDSNERFTIRGNTFQKITGTAIGGNMGTTDGHTHGGEICFNNIKDSGLDRAHAALRVNLNGEAGPTYVYRNTIRGRIRVENTDAADGPFVFTANVIVNSDGGSRISLYNVSAPDRVVFKDNIGGKSPTQIIDADGNFAKDYERYIGTHGHSIGSATSAAPR